MTVSSSSQPSVATETSKLTRLDRSLALILEEPDRTPSRKAGITPHVERLHRFHGTSVIFESSRGLSLGPSTFATACTIFHRFYHSASLTEYDAWSVAMASTLLATKVEEDAKSLKQIIDEYAKIYARRILLAEVQLDEQKDASTQTKSFGIEALLSSPHLACLECSKWPQQKICYDKLPQSLNKHGPVYKEWHDQITSMESILLRQLGFTFYWISDSHAHKFLLDFCRALELDEDKEVRVCVCMCVSINKRETKWHAFGIGFSFQRASTYRMVVSVVSIYLTHAFYCISICLLKVYTTSLGLLQRFLSARSVRALPPGGYSK